MGNSAGFSGINVGRTKTGKTTVSKSLIAELASTNKLFVYDVNREYTDMYTKDFIEFESFMRSVKDEVNSFLLFEEATIFFDVRSTDKILREMLVRKRHTNNIIYMNFHSINTIPKYVFNLVDYVTIFKTNDNIEDVKKKYNNPNFLKAFEQVQKDKNPFARVTVDLYK